MINRLKALILALALALVLCLVLVPATPANAATYDKQGITGEPACSGFVIKNCNMRSLYRNVYGRTTTNDRASVQAAVLMATAPYVGKDAQLRAAVANILYNMKSSSFGTNRVRCVRLNTLEAVKSQAKATVLSANIAKTFDAAKRATNVTGKAVRSTKVDTWFQSVFNAYLSTGKEAAKVAGKQTASANTRGHMNHAVMC
ncbi:hypothetical protein [Arthrobacter sp. N1]|uniref:hypothetical protein n=1 Tax=Arthrobacter sp. N1 TaxID=619291 RepID=UPI003BB0C2FE